MEKLIHDKNLRYSIKFSWEEQKNDYPYWIDFKALEIISYTEDLSEICYSQDDDIDFDKSYIDDPLCNGFIKWDGCMEIHNFNFHFCFYDDMMQRLVKDIYLNAKSIMKDRFEGEIKD